jgi:hypothetical protein
MQRENRTFIPGLSAHMCVDFSNLREECEQCELCGHLFYGIRYRAFIPVVSVRLHVRQGAELYFSHTSRIRRLRPPHPRVTEFLLRQEGVDCLVRL